MKTYNIGLNYVLNFFVNEIEAENENEALEKARDMVEKDTIISNIHHNVSNELLDFYGGVHIYNN